MPVINDIVDQHQVRVVVWRIDESVDNLEGVYLNDRSKVRLANMKSDVHKKGFLSVRKLLESIGLSDADLNYQASGKPTLDNGKSISITHSGRFSAIAIADVPVGIDIEQIKPVVGRIAHKFTRNERFFLNETLPDYLTQLTVIWGIKEAVFKIENKPGISFNDHISVDAFTVSDLKTTATLNFENRCVPYDIRFKTLADFALVVATYST